MSQAKHEMDLVPNEEAFEDEDITEILSQTSLQRLGGLRAFYFTDTVEQGICYINGSQVNFDRAITPVIKLMCDNVSLDSEVLSEWKSSPVFVSFIKIQLDLGYWYFSE